MRRTRSRLGPVRMLAPLLLLSLGSLASLAAANPRARETGATTERWIPLFLTVAYDRYPGFDKRFGHLAYARPLSHYRLRIEYRFVGQQAPGGPAWALRNSGVMLHGQSPGSMALDQDFPVSIEVQFLGGDGSTARPTANVCTPGTHVVMQGKLITQHCTPSRAPAFHGDGWVTVEVEVHGNRLIRHLVNGQPVLQYSQPQLDDADPQARRLIAQGASRQLDRGFIYLQAESHPVQFRKVELLELPTKQ